MSVLMFFVGTFAGAILMAFICGSTRGVPEDVVD